MDTVQQHNMDLYMNVKTSLVCHLLLKYHAKLNNIYQQNNILTLCIQCKMNQVNQ